MKKNRAFIGHVAPREAINSSREESRFGVGPASLTLSLLTHRRLLARLIERDVYGRYRGSLLGIGWSVVQPLLMLVVYTLVFSDIFQMRWPGVADGSRVQFAVMIFAANIVQIAFAEVISRSPTIIVSNTNLVRKVIFPLELLPVVALGSAAVHVLLNVVLLLMINAVFSGIWNWSCLFFPLVIVPFLIMTAGISWFLAAIGVFVRDLGQAVGVLLTLLLFLSPVFYPMSAVPERLRPFLLLNPLSLIAEQQRRVLVSGELPDFMSIGCYLAVACLVAVAGFAWFQKVRRGFADVL